MEKMPMRKFAKTVKEAPEERFEFQVCSSTRWDLFLILAKIYIFIAFLFLFFELWWHFLTISGNQRSGNFFDFYETSSMHPSRSLYGGLNQQVYFPHVPSQPPQHPKSSPQKQLKDIIKLTRTTPMTQLPTPAAETRKRKVTVKAGVDNQSLLPSCSCPSLPILPPPLQGW